MQRIDIKNVKSGLKVGIKLLLCGASIAAIAWAVGVFGMDGQVAESHADIAWLSPSVRTPTQSFQRGLKRLGHDEPQVFDLNGNTIYFSVAYSTKMPDEVMREYQNEFVRQGLNPRPFYDVDGDKDLMMATALSGGIIPLSMAPTRIVMGGMLNQAEARDEADLKQHFHDTEDPGALFNGHRHIEITRQAADARTAIISTWSDDQFDYDRMIPGLASTAGGADPVVPACLGCTRLTRFEDLGKNKNHVSSVFQGPLSIDDVRSFYDRAMRNRGWEPTDTHQAMELVAASVDDPGAVGQLLQYTRKGEFLTIIALPDPSGETTVVTTQSD